MRAFHSKPVRTFHTSLRRNEAWSKVAGRFSRVRMTLWTMALILIVGGLGLGAIMAMTWSPFTGAIIAIIGVILGCYAIGLCAFYKRKFQLAVDIASKYFSITAYPDHFVIKNIPVPGMKKAKVRYSNIAKIETYDPPIKWYDKFSFISSTYHRNLINSIPVVNPKGLGIFYNYRVHGSKLYKITLHEPLEARDMFYKAPFTSIVIDLSDIDGFIKVYNKYDCKAIKTCKKCKTCNTCFEVSPGICHIRCPNCTKVVRE